MREWRTLDEAPFADFTQTQPLDCLVWSRDIGRPVNGRVWKYEDGEAVGQANGYVGDWKVTHWMPLPEPPK